MTRVGVRNPLESPDRGARRPVARIAAALAPWLLLFGCASDPPPLELDPNDQTEEGLQAVVKPRVQHAWIRPGVDFAAYHSLYLAPIRIEDRPHGSPNRYPRTATGHYRLTEADRLILARELAAAFSTEIEKDEQLKLVDAPGPGVLVMQAKLLDVAKRVPDTTNYAGSTTVFANTAGQLTLDLEIRDGGNDELLARVLDRRDVRTPGVGSTGIGYTNVVVQTADVRRVFNRWARLMHERLAQLQAPGETTESKPASSDGS